MVGARSLDRLAAVMVMVMLAAIPYFLQVGPLVVGFGVLVVLRMKMSIAYASAGGIFRADVDATDFLTKIPSHSACISACCTCFLAHVA